MKNKLTKSLVPFVIFGTALAVLGGWIFLLLKFESDFLALLEVLAFFLFFWLVIEAAAQADPNQVVSPLGRFLSKYSNRRDKVVVVLASVAVLIVLTITSLLNANPFLIIVLSIVGAIVVYYGICLLFGTRELRDLVVPNFIKRIVSHKDSADE